MTTMVRLSCGLSDPQVLAIYHEVRADVPASAVEPSASEWEAFVTAQEGRVEASTQVSPARKASLARRWDTARAQRPSARDWAALRQFPQVAQARAVALEQYLHARSRQANLPLQEVRAVFAQAEARERAGTRARSHVPQGHTDALRERGLPCDRGSHAGIAAVQAWTRTLTAATSDLSATAGDPTAAPSGSPAPDPTASQAFTFDKGTTEACMHGDCWHLALTLHEKTGYPIVFLADTESDGTESPVHEMYWVHAMVRTPDGRLMDISGVHPESQVRHAWRHDITDDYAFRTLDRDDCLRAVLENADLSDLDTRIAQARAENAVNDTDAIAAQVLAQYEPPAR